MPREFILTAKKHNGERVVLAWPNTPLHEQQATYLKLLSGYPVNEEFAEVRLDELTPHRRKAQFVTAKAAAEKAKADKAAEKEAAKEREAEVARAAKAQDAQTVAALKEHQKKVAELDKLHDQIRAITKPK